MSINMELMRKKLAKLRGEYKGDGNSVWFKPDEGDQTIRIVPTADGDPLKEMYFHYNVGTTRAVFHALSATMVSAVRFVTCFSALARRSDQNDEESKKLAKSLCTCTLLLTSSRPRTRS